MVVRSSVTYRGVPLFAYLLPFLEESNAVLTWNYDDPLSNATQGQPPRTAIVLATLLCPSDELATNPIVNASHGWTYAEATSYGGNGGTRNYFPPQATADGLFHTTGLASEPQPGQRTVRPREITDGLSKTLLFGERSHSDPNYETFSDAAWGDPLAQQGWWGASANRKIIGHVTLSAAAPLNYRLPFNFAGQAGQSPARRFVQQLSVLHLSADLRHLYGSEHPGGANFCVADGSVHFITNDIDPLVLTALSTRRERPAGCPRCRRRSAPHVSADETPRSTLFCRPPAFSCPQAAPAAKAGRGKNLGESVSGSAIPCD